MATSSSSSSSASFFDINGIGINGGDGSRNHSNRMEMGELSDGHQIGQNPAEQQPFPAHPPPPPPLLALSHSPLPPPPPQSQFGLLLPPPNGIGLCGGQFPGDFVDNDGTLIGHQFGGFPRSGGLISPEEHQFLNHQPPHPLFFSPILAQQANSIDPHQHQLFLMDSCNSGVGIPTSADQQQQHHQQQQQQQQQQQFLLQQMSLMTPSSHHPDSTILPIIPPFPPPNINGISSLPHLFSADLPPPPSPSIPAADQLQCSGVGTMLIAPNGRTKPSTAAAAGRRQKQPRIRRRDRLVNGGRGGGISAKMARQNGSAFRANQNSSDGNSRQMEGANNEQQEVKEILNMKGAEICVTANDQNGNEDQQQHSSSELQNIIHTSSSSFDIKINPSASSSSSFIQIHSSNEVEANANGQQPLHGELPICAQCGEAIQERQMLKLDQKRKMPPPNATLIQTAAADGIKAEMPFGEEKMMNEDPPQQQQQEQQYFHCRCLKCSECEESLEFEPKCYVRNGLVYCAHCYAKHFILYCATCEKQIEPEPVVWFRRAHKWIYHLVCFKCEHCQRQLNTGEQFTLDDTVLRESQVFDTSIPRLLCKQHYMELVRGEQCSPKAKAKRVRTTFGEEQLAILQEHFKVDSNPDGADLERIAQLTGLTKRVTQVWFQNSRARQKKYSGGGTGSGGGFLGNSNKMGCSSSNSNYSSTNGAIGLDGYCRSSTVTPASSSCGCPNGQSPFGFIDDGVVNNDDSGDNNGGCGGLQHQGLKNNIESLDSNKFRIGGRESSSSPMQTQKCVIAIDSDVQLTALELESLESNEIMN